MDIGLKSLLEDLDDKSSSKNANESHSEAHNEMDDVAALAESIQPKGNTLLTTSVSNSIAFNALIFFSPFFYTFTPK